MPAPLCTALVSVPWRNLGMNINRFSSHTSALAERSSRRCVLRSVASGVGTGTILGFGKLGRGFAQDATPATGGFVPGTPVATLEGGQIIRSVSREEYAATLFAEFPVSEP